MGFLPNCASAHERDWWLNKYFIYLYLLFQLTFFNNKIETLNFVYSFYLYDIQKELVSK